MYSRPNIYIYIYIQHNTIVYIGKVLLYVLIADLHFGFLKNGVLYVVWTAVEHLWIGPHGFPTERIETSEVLLTCTCTDIKEHSHLVDHFLAIFRSPPILHCKLTHSSLGSSRGVELPYYLMFFFFIMHM